MSDLKIYDIPINDLEPNSWNPNSMDAEMLLHERASIREFGFVDPVTVRASHMLGRYEIIDGEQRWTAAKLEGLTHVPCILLDVDDETAKQLTLVLNDVRGRNNEEKLAALVRDLSAKRSMLDLERVLPYKREKLAEMVAERKADFDWEALRRPKPERKQPEERWVERIYRLPLSAAQVVDEAIEKVREDGVEDDWKALELICADYVAGA